METLLHGSEPVAQPEERDDCDTDSMPLLRPDAGSSLSA